MTTDPGLLVADDLPGPVAEAYRKANVALADKIYVLEYGTEDNEVFYAVALGSGIFAIGFLAAAGGSALRKA
jgi:hypothetical protein